MMKCCIKNCGNNSKPNKISQSSTSISERITFHLFPKDPKQRVSWLESLAIPNWVPTNKTVICSDHFKEDDFYFTKQGTRRIKYGVIPFIEDDCYGPAALRICRLCLSLNGKMYRLQDNGLDKMYQDVMGITPRTDTNNQLPMGICWECTARLQSAASFRSKALFSDALLQDHLKDNADLKISDILNIQRQHTNLKSTWTVQEVFKFNSHNVEEHAPNTLIKTEVIGIPHNEEIEIEVPNLVTDKTTIKDERKNEIIEETNPMADVKIEIDLVPIKLEIVENETDFEDDDGGGCIVTENIYANDAKIGFDNVVLLKTEEEIETMNPTNSIDSDDDDQVAVNDDIDSNICDVDDQSYVNDKIIRNVANETIFCIENKTTEVKKTKTGVKKGRTQQSSQGSQNILIETGHHQEQLNTRHTNSVIVNNNKKEIQRRYREQNREKLKQREAERRKRKQFSKNIEKTQASIQRNEQSKQMNALQKKRERQRRYREQNRDKLKQRKVESRRRLQNAEMFTEFQI